MSKYDVTNQFFDFHKIRIDETHQFPNAIERIQNREFDGLVVSDFLTHEELTKAVRTIDEMPLELRHQVRTGFTFPVAYFEADERSRNGGSMDEQFLQWMVDRKMLPEVLGFDVENRIKETFRDLGGGRDALVLEELDSDSSYIPATLRVFYPDMGGIPVHCGNMFDEMLPNLYNDLNSRVNTKNQLSYFILLQTPEKGGHLRIFDLEWEEGQKVISETDVALADGTTVSTEGPDRLKSFALELKPGDLIIFAAGEIWHKVDSPIGGRNRITVGGFLGFTKDKEAVAFWS